MLDDFYHLIYKELEPHHTDKNFVNLSKHDDKFKFNLWNRSIPISRMDLISGNFLLWKDNDNIILYKVLLTNNKDCFVTIAYEESSLVAMYQNDAYGRLYCYSHYLDKAFYLKISLNDVKNAVEESINNIKILNSEKNNSDGISPGNISKQQCF